MASKDERKLARRIVELGNRVDAQRAKQLPHTSIELDDGTNQGIAGGVTAAVDAYLLAEGHDVDLVDLSDISDNSAIESTFNAERFAISEGGSDSAFELGMAAVERVSKAQDAADQAAADALAAAQRGQQAFEAAAEATANSAAAEAAATEAMTTASQAAADVVAKANAAQAAAEEYARAQAVAAQAEAIAAASGDASDKAASAQAAAIAAAAEDAAVKAAQAEAAAKEVANAAKASAEAAIADAAQALAEASSALSVADRAQATADGRNRVFAQALNPVAPPGIPFVGGDLWYRTETVGGVVRFAGVNMWNGSEWKPYQLVADSLLVPGSIGAILIKNGEITGPKLAVDALNFKTATGMNLTAATITSPLVRTAEAGRRLEFNANGLQSFSASNTLLSALTPSDSGFDIRGGITLRPYLYNASGYYATLDQTGLSCLANTNNGVEQGHTIGSMRPGEVSLRKPSVPGSLSGGQFYVNVKGSEAQMFMNATDGSGTTDMNLRVRPPVPNPQSWDKDPGGIVELTATYPANLRFGSFIAPETPEPKKGQIYFDAPATFNKAATFTKHPSFPDDMNFDRIETSLGATLGSGMYHGVNSLYSGMNAAIRSGLLFLSGRLERSGGIPANHVIFTLPLKYRPSVPIPVYAYSSAGDNFVVMQPNGQCILAIASGLYVTVSMMPIPLGA